MPKTQAISEVKFFIQSNDPDMMGSQRWQGGIGTIIKSVFAPGMFSKESGKHALFRFLTIKEEDGVEHSVRYLRGWFGNTEKEGKKRIGLNMYPSKDGKTIAGPTDKSLEELLEEYAELAKGKGEDNTIPSIPEDELPFYEGVYTISMEETKAGNVDDKQLLGKIKELTLADPADPKSSPFDLDGRSDVLCGLKFQWDLLDQQYSFTPKDGGEKKEFRVLIPTHFFGMDEEWEVEHKANGKTKEKSTTSVRAVSSEDSGGESETEQVSEQEQNPFENNVEGVVVAFLTKVGKPVSKKDISTHVMNQYKTPDERKQAIALCGNNKWMTDTVNRPWGYENGQFSA